MINTAPGQTNFAFGGLLVQHDLSEHLTLGSEIDSQRAQFLEDRASTFYNVGGYFAPTKRFDILFSIGHAVNGDSQATAYVGLYWTGESTRAH